MNKTITAFLSALAALLLLSACDSPTGDAATEANRQEADPIELTVYKSPTCGCCADWVDHMEAAGFETLTKHPERLHTIKAQLGIEPGYASCHTGVTADGYVFEGHVPAKLVRRFLNNPPSGALGLAVPRMPVGSPGMEMGEQFEPYDVLLLMEDGRSEVYAQIKSIEQQH